MKEFSPVAKVIAVLKADAAEGVFHEVLRVRPDFYARFVEEFMTAPRACDATGRPPKDPPLVGWGRFAVWGPTGRVYVEPQTEAAR